MTYITITVLKPPLNLIPLDVSYEDISTAISIAKAFSKLHQANVKVNNDVLSKPIIIEYER